ncbi:MAG TPA: nucleoside monophosphate kinase [Candidatus Pacearchaeota archaeon]|nr:nucleoside monophosphate kinase [Candidatus Pacearchaeota archaeon]
MKNSNPLVIMMLGLPGSGKGTQANLFVERFKLDYIGSGDLLRERKKEKDFTGKKIRQTIDVGGLVPTPVIFKLWLDQFEKLKSTKKNLKGLVIDGSPRKILEAYLIDESLNWYEWDKNVKIFLIKISIKESFNRLTKRRQCKKCGRIIPWAGDFKKLKTCDQCGGELFTRPDDNIESIKKRIEKYKKETMKVIKYYKKQGKLIEINGEQSVEEVFQEIAEKIKS